MRSGEGTSEEGISLEGTPAEESVIVISDDEAEVTLGLGNSVLLIEEAEESFIQDKRSLEVLDEELAITFSKKAHVMPHARYDCTSNPFARAEQETEIPLEENANFCDECYCYLCDKRASECSSWTSSSCCHCNAHNKSKYWKGRRDLALAGVLTLFNFDLTEIDSELREGGNQLQHFISEFTHVQQKYAEGELVKRDSLYKCACACHRNNNTDPRCNVCALVHTPARVHNYTPVHQLVVEYLNKADEEHPKTAAVMLLGAARELFLQKILVSPFLLPLANANIKEATLSLMTRIVTTLQSHLVLGDYPKSLYDKFVMFFQSLTIPPYCYTFTNSLNVLRWDNAFLLSVLSGQNPSGVRTHKGKRESLWEPLPVVQARVNRLEEQKNYRQLVRYLNAVKCQNLSGLSQLKQKLPLYMCKFGDYPAAAAFLLQTKGMQSPMAKILTPKQLEFHLLMLRTRSCPPGNEPVAGDVWIPSAGTALKKGFLLRTAIRIVFSNNLLLQDPSCWSSLLRVWCTTDTLSSDGKLMPGHIFQPEKQFQWMVMDMCCHVLDELQVHFTAHLPDPFHKPHWVAAELILLVQAIFRFMTTSGTPLRNMLELVFAFGFNLWALELLIEKMTQMRDLLYTFMTSVRQQLQEQEADALSVFSKRGASYMSHLLSIFLLHMSECVRFTGFQIIDVMLQNIAKFPWTPIVGHNLRNMVLNFSSYPGYRYSGEERKQLQYRLGKLISR